MDSDSIDFRQIQGLVRFGYGRLTEASFLLVNIREAQAARAWLRTAPISNAVTCDAAPLTALQVAFTAQGLSNLGVPRAVLNGFSIEFRAGLAHEPGRSRLLGDIGANAPEGWQWGGPNRIPDVLLMLYAQPQHLDGLTRSLQTPDWHAGFELLAALPTADMGGSEPFGFADSLSQPVLDWERSKPAQAEQERYSNVASLGEFLLGYPNEYGRYTDRPLLAETDPDSAILPSAEDKPEMRDLGRNGCYLVLRTLEQDVQAFWKFVDKEARSNPEAREALASAMVGRRRDGTPLVPMSAEAIAGVASSDARANQFTFDDDARGTRCPYGAHIRRANPRNADLPTPPAHGIEKALQVIGLGQRNLHSDAKASTRFHRVLRRGREYGAALAIDQALHAADGNGPRGLQFICLVANIARQFEFLQGAWLMNAKFDAMTDESDPLLGNREPVSTSRTDAFTLPRERSVCQRASGVPQFVTVKGGAYFLLPSLPAIRYFAK
jgi:deferrochelatase/peroxidase EfeB